MNRVIVLSTNPTANAADATYTADAADTDVATYTDDVIPVKKNDNSINSQNHIIEKWIRNNQDVDSNQLSRDTPPLILNDITNNIILDKIEQVKKDSLELVKLKSNFSMSSHDMELFSDNMGNNFKSLFIEYNTHKHNCITSSCSICNEINILCPANNLYESNYCNKCGSFKHTIIRHYNRFDQESKFVEICRCT